MVDAALAALVGLANPATFLALMTGVAAGLVVGVLPGIGNVAGLALLLPFVFGLEPHVALPLMVGMAAVTSTSGSFLPVLVGIAGPASSQATVQDGFLMSWRGEGARALSVAFVSSLFGGLFGAAVLFVAVFLAQPIILSIGFAEQLMLVLLAFSMVGVLTGTNIWKGLAACAMGLMLGVIGAAPLSGHPRATLGFEYLLDPLPVVVVALAMFATPDIIDLLRRNEATADTGRRETPRWGQGVRDWWHNKWLSLRCAVAGCIIGVIPGVPGGVVGWVAYAHAMQTSKNRERYGTGDVRGVVAPESANNAKDGGVLVPTLLLGIPGSGGMAIFLAALALVGIEPGAEMVTNNLHLVYLIIFSLVVANVIGASICFLISPQMAKIRRIRFVLMAPFMVGIVFFAALQASHDWGDLVALFALTVLGVYMKRFGWSRPALLIGFVLSALVETGVYQTATLYGMNFLARPVVLGLLALTALSVVFAVVFKPTPTRNMAEDGPYSHKNTAAQWSFIAAIAVAAVCMLIEGAGFKPLTGVYQVVVSLAVLGCLAPLAVIMLVRRRPDTCFYDAEHGGDADGEGKSSAEFFIALLLGMLLLSACVGFVLGITLFIFLLLWWRGGVSPLNALLGAGGFMLFLGILSVLLSLQYPAGLLQNWITLPWPFQ